MCQNSIVTVPHLNTHIPGRIRMFYDFGMFGVYHIWCCQSGHANAGALWHFSWWWPHRSHSWGEIWATARASYQKEMGSPSIIMFHDIHVMFHHVQTCFSFLSKHMYIILIHFDWCWFISIWFCIIMFHGPFFATAQLRLSEVTSVRMPWPSERRWCSAKNCPSLGSCRTFSSAWRGKVWNTAMDVSESNMAMNMIHYLVRWCSHWNPHESSGVPMNCHVWLP